MTKVRASAHLLKVVAKLASSASAGALTDAIVSGDAGAQAAILLGNSEISAVADARSEALPRPPWLPAWVVRLAPDTRFGSSELHKSGGIYLLDLSSIFCAVPLVQITQREQAPEVLDLCAAPGGKSVFAFRALSPGMLVCNETIGKRLPALISNLSRCQVSPVEVTSVDSAVYAQAAARRFDAVIVDAPCSGQSLCARGESSPGCFHPATINMNSNRQKRILANAGQAVKVGGYLLYSTCTYSPEENERVLEWFLKKFPEFEAQKVVNLEGHRSKLSDQACYRLFPTDGFGAGGFCALLRRMRVGKIPEQSGRAIRVEWRG